MVSSFRPDIDLFIEQLFLEIESARDESEHLDDTIAVIVPCIFGDYVFWVDATGLDEEVLRH